MSDRVEPSPPNAGRADEPEDEFRTRWPAHRRAAARVALCALVATLAVRCGLQHGSGYRPHRPRENVARLARMVYGLEVVPTSVVFLSPMARGVAGALGRTDVAFLARQSGGVGEEEKARDVYLLEGRFSPAGIPLGDGTLTNLSHTEDADESDLLAAAPRLAFASRSGGRVHNVQVLDLRGEDPSLFAGFTGPERLMAGITNLQETGRWHGFDHRIVDLTDPPTDVRLSWDRAGERLTIQAGSGEVVYDASSRLVVRGAGRVYAVEKGKNSLLGWAVDTVRALPFVGPARIGWLEDKYYTLLDEVDRTRRSRLFVWLGLEPKDLDVAGDIGETIAVDRAPPVPGWPPKRVPPIASHPMKGEGEWQPQTREVNPYYPQNPNAPVPLYESFIRPDPEGKPGAIVYGVAFDPRQLTVDTIAGTKEPAPSTGAVGTGEIPRDDRTLSHLVAAFEGGWQTVHADFGERTDGVDITAPQPYGATLARMDDATIGLGTWGAKGGLDSVPPSIVSFRQNLTPLTSGDKVNPYARDWWGSAPNKSAPPGVAPTQFINRSAICLHPDGYLIYFWGRQLNASMLSKAVLQFGCVYTQMLDVNLGMAGFEFYRVHHKGDEAAGAKSEADYAAIDKPVPDRPDLVFDARELVHQMHWPRFPRYIGRDTRDYIILELRDILPGADLVPPIRPALTEPFAEGVWQTGGVYQGPAAEVFPPTVAWTYVRPDLARPTVRVDVAKIDPRKVDVALELGARESDAPADLAAASQPLVGLAARIGLGLTDPEEPGGLATEGHLQFAPRPGWPTLAVYQTSLFGKEPRIAIGTWGRDLPANEEGLVALVQGRPDGRRYDAPRALKRGQRVAAAEAGSSQAIGVALDEAGFLVVAATAEGGDALVDEALRLAGCHGAIVRLATGRSPGTLELTRDGSKLALLPDEAPLDVAGESALVFSAHPRPYAEQIFTDTPQVVDKAAVAKAQKFRKIAPPATQPAGKHRHHGPASAPVLGGEPTGAATAGPVTTDAPDGTVGGLPLGGATTSRSKRHRKRHHAIPNATY